MRHDQFQVLTREQRQHFIEKGYVTVKGCVDRSLARDFRAAESGPPVSSMRAMAIAGSSAAW